jgi:hypothetical protein
MPLVLKAYIAPHRHLVDFKSECLIAVSGLFAAVIFSVKGDVDHIEFLVQKNLRI